MRKLKLDLDDLDVQTFHVAPPAARGGGTVRGNETGQWDVSCGGTCDGTCGNGCWENVSAGSCYNYSCGDCPYEHEQFD